MNLNFRRKLPIPQDVKAEFPLSEKMVQVKAARDEEIKRIFNGSSDKFLLIIGPCSADHSEPVLEYISRLRRVADQVSDKILMIPRIYTNKPRTTGHGYKGMLHQPDPQSVPLPCFHRLRSEQSPYRHQNFRRPAYISSHSSIRQSFSYILSSKFESGYSKVQATE